MLPENAELIKDMKKNGEDPELIKQAEQNLKNEENNGNAVSVEKSTGTATEGNVDVVPENTNTELESEDGSLAPIEEVKPELLFTVNDEELTLEQVKKMSKGTDLSVWLKENNGVASFNKEKILDEVRVTPQYQDAKERADELFELALKDLFRTHEGTLIDNTFNRLRKTDGSNDLSDNAYLNDNYENPLTGLENVTEVGEDGISRIIGVRRSNTNLKGNQSITSLEMKMAAHKIKLTLEKEDSYIGGYDEGSFNYNTNAKVSNELAEWSMRAQLAHDWDAYDANDVWQELIYDKIDELWAREAANDPEYQRRYGVIDSIVQDQFETMIINKSIEEERSFLIPDHLENSGTIVEAIYKFGKYTLPSLFISAQIGVDGDNMYGIVEQLKKHDGLKSDTKGYIKYSDNGNATFYTHAEAHEKGSLILVGNPKATTWSEAQVILKNQSDMYGEAIMKNIVESNAYQEKLSLLGTPEILDENWDWNLDTDGYLDIIGTQLGQMTLGALTFGGSTFIQELGGMTQESIADNAALLFSGVDIEKFRTADANGDITNAQKQQMREKFFNAPQSEIDRLSMEVLKTGMIDFDKLYSGAAGSAGLDLVGNFFVLAKGAKLVPKQILTGFMQKNLKMFLGGLKTVGKLAATGTFGEMLTESLQNLNSQRVVSGQSLLHTFDARGLALETLTAAVVPGPLILVGQSAQVMVQSIKAKSKVTQKGSYDAWFDLAEKKVNASYRNGDIKSPAHEKAIEQIEIARQALSSVNLKDVKVSEQRDNITNSLIEQIGFEMEIKKLNEDLKKAKKDGKAGPDYESKIEEQVALLNDKISKQKIIQVKNKAVSHYLTNSERQAHWQNQQKEGENANRHTVIFKTTKEAKAYILKNFPTQLDKFKNLLTKGSYGTNARNITMPDGTKANYNFAITENVIAGIMNDFDLLAGNVINHEQAHDNLQQFDSKELGRIRIAVTTEMVNSTDPEIQQVLFIMNRKLSMYGPNPSHEEFYTAMSDAFHALDMADLTLGGKNTLSALGEVYSNSFSDNIGPIVNWKEGFDKMGVIDFIKSYTKRSDNYYASDVIEDIRGGKEPKISNKDVSKNSAGMYTQDSRRVYPSGRTTQEIKQANSILADEMLKEKTSPSYVNEADPALQTRIRADQMKKLQGELIANNMGLINLFLKHKGNGGLYFDPSAGLVDYTDFSEAVMGEVSTIMNTYDPSMGNFAMYLGGLMDKRIPGIWQKLVGNQSKEFRPDPDKRQDDQANSSYDDFVSSFDEKIISLDGEEVTEKQATSEMRKTLGIKEGDPLYNEILDDVIEVLITDFAALNEEGFYLDTKDKIAKKLAKKLKIQLGSPQSEKYITWLNDNVERLYKLLPQSVFNKSYTQFTVEGERANVKKSNDKDLENKSGVKIKSATAGNVIRTKVPYTDEIGEQFIANLLEGKRPDAKQNSLITQLGGVIGIDAISTAVNSSAFKDAHGDQNAIMGYVADVINRDMSVQFSDKTLGIKYEIKTTKQFQNAMKLMRVLSLSGITSLEEGRVFIEKTAEDLNFDKNVAGFVIHLDSLDIIEKGDATKFKSDLGKFLEKNYPDVAIEFQADGSIAGNKTVLDKIAEEVTIFTGGMDPEMLDAIGFDIFAFHRRVLNAAETQQGPKRILTDRKGNVITVQKQNKKFPDGNQSYANATTTLKLEGWTFNQKTNEFMHNEGKLKNSADPVKEHGATTISAPYFETLTNIKNKNEAKKGEPGYTPSNKYKNVRIQNVGVSGGLFQKIAKILNDKTIVDKDGKTAREIRIELITRKHGTEIENANKANTELATDISIQLIEAVKDDKMSVTTFFHLLQSQTNMAYGFRGLTKLQMISVLEGAYSEEGGRAYGEHVNPNSGKMLELAKIGIRAKNDPDYNYMEAVAILFADHDQVLFTSGDAKTIDTSKLLGGPTSTASYDRLKALTPAQRASFIGPKGQSYKVMMAEINFTNNVLIETAKKKFESKRYNEILAEQNKDVVISESLSVDFNEIIEVTEGVPAVNVYSKAQSTIQGANAGNFIVDTLYPPSAYDMEMFTYKYMTKGKEGERQATFFKNNLFIPYERGIQAIDNQKKQIREDYKRLVKELPVVEKNLNDMVEGTNFSSEQAIRVYIWSKKGIEIPGLSKRDQKALVAAVEANPELILFADRLSAIAQQEDGYVTPGEYWTIETIASDLSDMAGSAGRAKHLANWKKNVSEIFSEENMSKIGKIYGPKHVEALRDMLYRMEFGRNKSRPGRIEQEWNNWVNNSVGAVMFFNMRSAALQTISAVNYIDWENNHPGNAALAFANQPQFWKDFTMIYNSDYLVERRDGNTRTVNEAELATHLKGQTNKAKAALAYLLEKGFTPTQIADSFAIASGGSAYYRNQVKAYEKSGMTTEEAEAQAFLDFRDKTEKGQQSSRADMISQQQAGGLGRLILAFKNTPMQYNRIMIKAMADIKNKRGSLKGNLSKIAYYGVVQSVIFNSLQTALFSALGDEDEWDSKKERVANGMVDSILGGMGLTGAVLSTVKNGYMMYRKQKSKGYNADHARTILAFANLSPTIGSKLRKLYGGIQTEAFNEGSIKEMGFNIENPAYAALANVVSAFTNIPVDRVVGKINNIILASSSETEAMDRIALLMGWNSWDLGIKTTKAKEVNKEFKVKKKEEKKQAKVIAKKIENDEKEQVNIELQKKEKKEGKDVTCSFNTSRGRCGVKIKEGKTRCTIHERVKMKKDGVKSQCKHVKKNKKRCGVQTASKSGLCYYHD